MPRRHEPGIQTCFDTDIDVNIGQHIISDDDDDDVERKGGGEGE